MYLPITVIILEYNKIVLCIMFLVLWNNILYIFDIGNIILFLLFYLSHTCGMVWDCNPSKIK